MKALKHSRLSRILMFYILLFTAVITFLTTGLTVHLEYKEDLKNINKNIEQIKESYLESISNSLWQFDSVQLKALIAGISKLPDVAYVAVRSNKGVVYSLGKEQTSNRILKRYALYTSSSKHKLGELVIVSTLNGAYERAIRKLFIVLFSQAINTFLLAFFIYLLIMSLITKRLQKLIYYLSNLDVNRNTEPLTIRRPGVFTLGNLFFNKTDEIDLVSNAIFNAQVKLRSNYLDIMVQEDSLRKLSSKLISTQEEERAKISRDLHDDIGQKLAVLKMNFAGKFKSSLMTEDELRVKRSDIFSDIDDLVQSVRQVGKMLSPTILYSFGLVDAIKWLLDESFKNSDIEYILLLDKVTQAKEIDLNLAVYRILQESISNIIKYADAMLVEVSLTKKHGIIKLIIRDDGVGIKEEDLSKITSTGIVGMKERLRSVNGSLSIKNDEKLGGVVLIASIPVENK